MSWQIGNEPRAFSKEQLPAFEKWLGEASKLIRSLDKNHLISIGSEGKWGCEGELNCWERICADKNVDYCNIHLVAIQLELGKKGPFAGRFGRILQEHQGVY